MPAMTPDNAIICQHFFAGMARSYGIVATNLMAVTLQRGNAGRRRSCAACPQERTKAGFPRWSVGTRWESALAGGTGGQAPRTPQRVESPE